MESTDSTSLAVEHGQDCAERRRLRDQGAMFVSSNSRSSNAASNVASRSWTMGAGRNPPSQRPRRSTTMREHREEDGSTGRSTAEQHLDEQA
mmetsp:Transcript_20993/g.48617  ORF Transcript_20993/g.48617 Transcript_20993/m.48617 type:complete len:92 (-) Transcript_20993:433-708(-)